MTYSLWETESGNVVGTFATEAGALALVRSFVESMGEEYLDTFSLTSTATDGTVTGIAAGANLVALARAPALVIGALLFVATSSRRRTLGADKAHGAEATESEAPTPRVAGTSQSALDGPWVQTAVLCEHVNQEPNGGVVTLHRILERTVVEATWRKYPRRMPAVVRDVALYLWLNSDQPNSAGDLAIEEQGPNNEVESLFNGAVVFDDLGDFKTIFEVNIAFTLHGRYQYHIYFANRLLTKVTLYIDYHASVDESAST